MAYHAGALLRVLEDEDDTDALSGVKELLCIPCNQWFDSPALPRSRQLTGELVVVTGLKGKGTIKTVATGVTFPFQPQGQEKDAADALRSRPPAFAEDLLELASQGDAVLALRVKEEGDPNTWVYRLDRRRLRSRR